MAIRGSILQSQRTLKGGAGFLNSGSSYTINRISKSIAFLSNGVSNQVQSFPGGYRVNEAILVSLYNGGLAGRAAFLSEVSASIIGVGYLNGSATLVISVSANGQLLASLNGSINVTFTTACAIMGIGYMAGIADLSAQPTAADIAGEAWAIRLDGDYTARDLMKLMAAVLVGKTTITDLGGGNANVIFRDLNDTVDRVEAEMDGSERTTVTKILT